MELENWDDLRVFLHVARTGGLTAARDVLRMDVATVGRRITRLETSRGAVLFQRSPKGYTLTQAGQNLLAHVDAAESNLKAGLGTLSQDLDRLEGQVRIGAPDGCANYVLPQVCAAIAREHPALDLQIVALPRLFNLSRREADMAIGVSPPTAGRLLVQKIADYQLHLAAAKDLAGQIKDTGDLQSLQIVGYIPDMIFDRELDYLGQFGLPRVHLSSNSIAVQMNLLQTGVGVGVVHKFAMPFAPNLKPVLPNETLNRSFYLIRAKEDQKDQRLTRVSELVRDKMRDEIARLEGLAGH